MTWSKTNGKWTLSLGHRGTRVRVFQREPGGVFYRDVWVAGRKDRRSLTTTDRQVAERRGKALLAALLQESEHASAPARLTLGVLWDAFQSQCAAWQDNGATLQRDDRHRAAVLLAAFGADRVVVSLTANDCTAYAAQRRAGGIRVVDQATPPVRQRTVQADLVLLKQMTRWATQMRHGDGTPWLASDPLATVVIPREADIRRPVASKERYDATRAVLARWKASPTRDVQQRGWYLDTALVLAYRVGRRLSAIRQLRWEDVQWSSGDVTWRAASDKRRRTAVRPLPQDVLEQLREFQGVRAAIGGPLFASARDPQRPYDRHWFDKWLVRAEQEAELPKLEGSVWHAYRRRWASDRADQGLKGVMEYAGWSDTRTVLHYMHLDREQLLAVVGEPKQVQQA